MSEHDIFHNAVVRKMWAGAILMAVLVFLALLFYVHLYYGTYSLLAISSAVAGTAGIMIGSSFAMSGMAFYFDFLDARVAYRKYMGLLGFWLALLYSFMLLFLDTNRYYYGFFQNLPSVDFVMGLSAMGILTFMALISNESAMKRLGPQTWRRFLRLGYLAYLFLVIRAFNLEWGIWSSWWQSFDGVPPPRLVITIFAISVILLRGSMIIAKFLRRNI